MVILWYLQDSSSRSNRSNPPKLTIADRNFLLKWSVKDRPRLSPSNALAPIQLLSSLALLLEPDGQLTPAEHQHHLDLGLYIHCRQSDHLARNCSKQAARNLPTREACGALIDSSPLPPELSKNEIVALPVPRRTTAFLRPRNPYWSWTLPRLDLQRPYMLSSSTFVLAHGLKSQTISPLSLFLIDGTINNFVSQVINLSIKFDCGLLCL